MSVHTLSRVRELDHRFTDGIDVRLLWSQESGRVTVAVQDRRSGELFSVDVRSGEQAYDVFHHPYAYAAHHRIDISGLEDLPAQAA
jgi:hypothetical protein